MAASGSRSPPAGCLWRLVRTFLLLAVLVALAAGAVGWMSLQHFARELPDIRDLGDYRPREVTRVYASDGALLAELLGDDAVHRTVVPPEAIPEVMRQAIIAAEDNRFYEHPGVDWIGVARAVLTNLRRGELSQGASTITQQLVKNLVLSPERSLRRKLQEALLAQRLERYLTKDEILHIYLNHVFFGARYYGVESAARFYFGHGAADLSLAEAALLAGLPQSPNRYNPYRNPDAALARRGYVLRQMFQNGFITESAWQEAQAEPLALASGAGWGLLPGEWMDVVYSALDDLPPEVDRADVFGGGLRIHLSVDPQVQQWAQDALRAGLRDFDQRHGYLRPARTIPEAQREAWVAAESATGYAWAPGDPRPAMVVEATADRVTVARAGRRFALNLEPRSRHCPAEGGCGAVFEPGMVFTVERVERDDGGPRDEALPPEVRLVTPPQGAVVVLDAEADTVVALVHGYDPVGTGFRRAQQARRQVGSTFKAFVYAAALESRVVHPAQVFLDQPYTFRIPGQPNWTPGNYDGEYLGPMSIRDALARSRNVIAVRVLELLGVDAFVSFCRRMGMEGPMTPGLPLALGAAEMTPLELTTHFATLAAGGFQRRPRLVLRVEDSAGQRRWTPPQDQAPTRVLDEGVAWLATSLLRSVVTAGTGTAARGIPGEVAGKTGTTNGARDAWFVGYDAQRVVGIWIGRDDNRELGRRESGGRSALPVFVRLMGQLVERDGPRSFPPPPAGVEGVWVDAPTGLRSRAGRAGAVQEFFLAGTAPLESAPETGERAARDSVLLGADPRPATAAPGDGSSEGPPAPPRGLDRTLDEL
jgi:penicillin-binding protein 1A